MARYTGPRCRLCRREGAKLFLKGNKCDTAKCHFERRAMPPGMHGQRRGKLSDYGVQLREKQKLKRMSAMMERQFKIFFQRAEKKEGITGDNLLQFLSLRLDNVVLKSGFATSRGLSRQLVRHGHIKVNGKKVNIPSFMMKTGDKLEIKDTQKNKTRITEYLEKNEYRKVPEWLSVDKNALQAEIVRIPSREDFDFSIQENMIVELYSK